MNNKLFGVSKNIHQKELSMDFLKSCLLSHGVLVVYVFREDVLQNNAHKYDAEFRRKNFE